MKAVKGKTRDNSTYTTLCGTFKLSSKYAYYIIWKYAPDEMDNCPSTYEGLKEKYPTLYNNVPQHNLETAMNYEHVQTAVMWLLKKMDKKRDIELYNIYYELAKKGDTQALKAYMDFKKTFFADAETSELQKIVEGANIATEDDEEELTMEL